MPTMIQIKGGVITRRWLDSTRRIAILLSLALFLSTVNLYSQCPNDDQTKVIKPNSGTGYYFYRFLGESSFRYFIDGKEFSFNDKDHPFRTFVFVDDVGYESVLVERAELAKYVKSSKETDILRAQAKHMQDHFKKSLPTLVVTDYGPSPRKNPDGSVERLFYLWKKENAPGDHSATQFLLSTIVKGGVVVLSIMPLKTTVSEDDLWKQIWSYTSHFNLLSADQCKQVLSMPPAS
jgi:hypothetical protein